MKTPMRRELARTAPEGWNGAHGDRTFDSESSARAEGHG
jgi:hypothetical protein